MQKHPTPLDIRIAIVDAIGAHNEQARADMDAGLINNVTYLHRLFPVGAHDVIRDAIAAACETTNEN